MSSANSNRESIGNQKQAPIEISNLMPQAGKDFDEAIGEFPDDVTSIYTLKLNGVNKFILTYVYRDMYKDEVDSFTIVSV